MNPADLIARLNSLAERVEKATGPDATLDLAIARQLRLPIRKSQSVPTGRPFEFRHAPERSELAFTSSLDAAMTLAGDDWADVLSEAIVEVEAWFEDKLAQRNALPRFATAGFLRAVAAQVTR